MMDELTSYDYKLPEELIAATPTEQREQSRLLCMERTTGRISHAPRFSVIEQYLHRGDLLFLNDARVMPARLEGRRKTGGKAEVLLVRPAGEEDMTAPESATRWIALLQSSGTIRPGEALNIGGENTVAHVEEKLGNGYVSLRFDGPDAATGKAMEAGTMPLPPYIRRARRRMGLPEDIPELDRSRYQTVYARTPGAVAAPTAGLHFPGALLERLRRKGVEIQYLTLMVGPGTFMPVRNENIEQHRIDPEFYILPPGSASALLRAKSTGRRVIATGTTCVRALEHVARTGNWSGHTGWADLFIRPPFEFKVTDALITNFHLPRSTLLMLVSAFAGRENILEAYKEAIRRRYRFYSYGDATFLY